MRWVLLLLAACDAGIAASPDAFVEPTWARYTIAPGEHDARLDGDTTENPIQGLTDVVGRDYELVLDPSASYTLEMPVQPEDQYDWNKLPGLSDCGEVDLARDGAMFGWRWSVELSVLEITAYANNAGEHLTIDAPLFTLDADDLAARVPIRYSVAREPAQYTFTVDGVVRGRSIAGTATLPRRCSDQPLDPLAWAGAFYFGGTSTAPHEITAHIRELRR